VVLAFLSAVSVAVAAQPDVANLMTQQTAAVIYGLPVLPGRPELIGQMGGHSIRFNGAEPVGILDVGGVEIGVMDTRQVAEGASLPPQQIFDIAAKQPEPGRTIEALQGLGQEAIYAVKDKEKSVFVLSGVKILIVSVISSKNPGAKAALIQAATAALLKI